MWRGASGRSQGDTSPDPSAADAGLPSSSSWDPSSSSSEDPGSLLALQQSQAWLQGSKVFAVDELVQIKLMSDHCTLWRLHGVAVAGKHADLFKEPGMEYVLQHEVKLWAESILDP